MVACFAQGSGELTSIERAIGVHTKTAGGSHRFPRGIQNLIDFDNSERTLCDTDLGSACLASKHVFDGETPSRSDNVVLLCGEGIGGEGSESLLGDQLRR